MLGIVPSPYQNPKTGTNPGSPSVLFIHPTPLRHLVWLVEDSLIDHQLIREGIKQSQLPIDAVTARDGQAALQLLAECENTYVGCPSFILLDLNLPAISGLEAPSKVRQSSSPSGPPQKFLKK